MCIKNSKVPGSNLVPYNVTLGQTPEIFFFLFFDTIIIIIIDDNSNDSSNKKMIIAILIILFSVYCLMLVSLILEIRDSNYHMKILNYTI